MIDEPIDEEDCERDPAIVQSIIRRQEIDGSEVVEGSVRNLLWGPGSNRRRPRVVYSPPLSAAQRGVPGPGRLRGRIRVALSQAYGLRIEAAAGIVLGTTSIDVAFIATVSIAQSTAA